MNTLARNLAVMELDHALAEVHAILDGRDFSLHVGIDPLCLDGWALWSMLAGWGEWQ